MRRRKPTSRGRRNPRSVPTDLYAKTHIPGWQEKEITTIGGADYLRHKMASARYAELLQESARKTQELLGAVDRAVLVTRAPDPSKEQRFVVQVAKIVREAWASALIMELVVGPRSGGEQQEAFERRVRLFEAFAAAYAQYLARPEVHAASIRPFHALTKEADEEERKTRGAFAKLRKTTTKLQFESAGLDDDSVQYDQVIDTLYGFREDLEQYLYYRGNKRLSEMARDVFQMGDYTDAMLADRVRAMRKLAAEGDPP